MYSLVYHSLDVKKRPGDPPKLKLQQSKEKYLKCNLDLVALNLVTTCDFVTILQRPFFNLIRNIIRFSDMRFSDSLPETKSVTKSRLH